MGRMTGGVNPCPVPGCVRYKPFDYCMCRSCWLCVPPLVQLEVERLRNRGSLLPGYGDAVRRAIAYASSDQTPF